jgi:hypothetical protein
MDIVRDDPVLFSDGDLSATLRNIQEAVKTAVNDIPQEQLLSLTLDELVERIVERHQVAALELHVDRAELTTAEISISIDRFPDRWLFGQRPGTVAGQNVSYHVPFSGDPSLFRLRPNSYTSNPPEGTVRGKELVLSFQAREVGPHMKEAYEGQIQAVRRYVDNQRVMIEPHNKTVAAEAKRLLTERINRVRQAEAAAVELGVPLRKR